MPGAFAHITAVNEAFQNSALQLLSEMPMQAKRILSSQQEYVELGAVSPDYPYLALMDKPQNKWADLMHYEKSGGVIRAAVRHIVELPPEERDKAFAWLCGYTAHVIADITIHPVVERKVGPYEENKAAHRICEMNQDAYIWQRLNLGEIGLADRVRLNIGACTAPGSDELCRTVKHVWGLSLQDNYPDIFVQTPPDFNKWHNGFQSVVDNADEGHRLFPFARHVAAGLGVLYPNHNEVDFSFINGLDTPKGIKNYDEVFDLAVVNIRKYWTFIAQAVFTDRVLDEILDWNLDNGLAPDGSLTAWE